MRVDKILRSFEKAKVKLEKLAGKIDDELDESSVEISNLYMRQKDLRDEKARAQNAKKKLSEILGKEPAA
jgi:hypothetical protein